MIDQLKTDFDKTITNLKLSNKNLKIRKKNLNQLSENGFPSRRIEDWKGNNEETLEEISNDDVYDELLDELETQSKSIH